MKALLYASHGSTKVLQYTQIKDPQAGSDDAIVRVRASALNRIDVNQRAGTYTVPGFQLPHVGGLDIAGEIAHLGANVAQEKHETTRPRPPRCTRRLHNSLT